MLITKEWSDPKPLEYGKNILIRSFQGNFSYKIYSARGRSVEGVIDERVHTICADDVLVRLIRLPMIAFRANTNDELHVDFELM